MSDRSSTLYFHDEVDALFTGQQYRFLLEKMCPVELRVVADGVDEVCVQVGSDGVANGCLIQEEQGTCARLASGRYGLCCGREYAIHVPESSLPDARISVEVDGCGGAVCLNLQGIVEGHDESITDGPIRVECYVGPESIPVLDGESGVRAVGTHAAAEQDDEDVLFMLELDDELVLDDGSWNIEHLTPEQCELIAQAILGVDYQYDELYLAHIEAQAKGFWQKNWKTIIDESANLTMDVWDHRRVLQDFSYRGTLRVQKRNGRQYVVFSGRAGLRKHFTGPRYGALNPKVFSMTWQGALGDAKKLVRGKGHTFAIIVSGALDLVEWVLTDPEDRHVADLLIDLGVGSAKVVLTAVATAFAVTGLLALAAAVSVGLPVFVVVVGAGLFIGFAITKVLDAVDDRFGLTDSSKRILRGVLDEAGENMRRRAPTRPSIMTIGSQMRDHESLTRLPHP